jgi:hypothetical protein
MTRGLFLSDFEVHPIGTGEELKRLREFQLSGEIGTLRGQVTRLQKQLEVANGLLIDINKIGEKNLTWMRQYESYFAQLERKGE